MEEEMTINGGHIFCPKCNAPLKVNCTITGSDEEDIDDGGIDDITTQEVASRIFINGLEIAETVEDANCVEDVEDE